MPQGSESNRRSSLDDKKTRAAGRTKQRQREEIRESMGARPRGSAGGASGAGQKYVSPGARPGPGRGR